MSGGQPQARRSLSACAPARRCPPTVLFASGQSSLDESPVTGESVPVDKGPGMKVFAASINRQGALEIEATAAFADNTLSKIIHLVEEAQERKGKAQQWIERFGRRYSRRCSWSPGCFCSCLGRLICSWEQWSLRAVVLLVAAAPCALIMSTPMAMAAGIGAAGRRGILIKGGAHLEHLGIIRVVAFDKTGTLTHGEPAVTDVIPLQRQREGTAVRSRLGLEHFSEHPLAKAILNKARETGVSPRRGQRLRGADRRRRQGSRIRDRRGTWAIRSCLKAKASI